MRDGSVVHDEENYDVQWEWFEKTTPFIAPCLSLFALACIPPTTADQRTAQPAPQQPDLAAFGPSSLDATSPSLNTTPHSLETAPLLCGAEHHQLRALIAFHEKANVPISVATPDSRELTCRYPSSLAFGDISRIEIYP